MIRFLLAGPVAMGAALVAAGPAHAQTASPSTPAPSATPQDTAPAGTAAPMGTPAQGAPATGAPATPATIAVGAAVNDQAGQPVGTISQLTADAVVIDTGTVKAGVPRASVGPGPNGGLITTVTKAQIEAAASQGAAQLKSMLVAGTAVHASDGTTTLGTVKAADDQFVTVGTDKGDVRLPATAFSAQNGNLVTSLTADQFASAVSQSLAAAPASASSKTTTETKTTTRSRRR